MGHAVTPSPVAPCLRSGGDPGARALARRLHVLMHASPQVIACRTIHPQDPGHGEQQRFGFVSGWPGGPLLLESHHDAPLLCCRHPGFAIAAAEAAGRCFRPALEVTVADAGLRALILPRVEARGEPVRHCAVT
jgi:truncated hemoglobin YjbI